MNLSELYTLYRQHPTVTTDSRTCTPGSIFFALKGDTFDGNAYAEKALQAGCSYAVVDDRSIRAGKNRIVVENVLETLQQLAALHRKTLGVTVIGITGTNGKTTTKELLSAVLSQKYKTLCTQGNLNNHIGVPLTLLRLTEAHEIAVIEMGANHPGEIRSLADIAQPHYGIVTNVGQAHLEGFGSLEGVIKTKKELYEFLQRTNGKTFINRNDEHLAEMAGDIEQIPYGLLPSASGDSLFAGGCIIAQNPFLSLKWKSYGETPVHTINTHLIGSYNLWNILAAVTAGLYFNISAERINAAIAGYKPNNNRSQLKKTASNTLIIDAYNANPNSMQAALENFAALELSPKAVILGDMRELGQNSLELHEDIIRQIGRYDFEKILLCGEQFSEAASRCDSGKILPRGEQSSDAEKEYACFPDVDSLVGCLEKKPPKGYHILIKGSRALHLEKTIDKL
ncbi:MAG: UDP-N-acetylmuramoyl-tripeptide--D-alanyl-D-alanine ligase [Tannerella sp.]|jgi:UDP-N-acetylmuramoyl-tripeptide--D-alanyl-D-alanine ligase|nr:UDP-N-acetylmuramoyl-tripeptide--D-alanyl-D-alanine ligase [Tannerella sp.]